MREQTVPATPTHNSRQQPERRAGAAIGVELIRDADRRAAYLLRVDGVAQSYVDLDDPTHLEFDYVRSLADVADLAAPQGAALHVVHIGGGGCTLPRYLAARRPGSAQLVYEIDAEVLAVARERLGLRRVRGLRVRQVDGAVGLPRLPAGSLDLIVNDAFRGWAVPAALTTTSFVAAAARALRESGVYTANIGDGQRLAFARAALATLGTAFRHVAAIAEPAVLRGRRFGNLVLVASAGPLPEAALIRRSARAAGMARVLAGADLVAFVGAAEPIRRGAEPPAPAPPSGLFAAPGGQPTRRGRLPAVGLA